MSGISKDKLVFDTTATLDQNDNVGAFLRGADGTLITHTANGGKDGLDVYLINTSIVVTATDLDIRDLNSATDSVTVIQGTSPWVIGDGGGSITVDAVDLDIRDLDATQDNVAISDGTNTLAVNADGSINVNADISVVNGSDKAEDSASASGDIGTYVLSVRQDTLATSTSTDGDYQSFKTDSLGSLWVRQSTAPASPSSAILGSATSVTTTATALPTTALAQRKKMIVQNLGNKEMFIGSAAVTTSTGARIAAGSNVELELGPSITLYGIVNAGTVDVRVLEIA
jgi:hypothetical protein